MPTLPKNNWRFDLAVFVVGLVLAYLAGILPYDQIGDRYTPLLSLSLMFWILCGICAIAVILVKRFAISMGLAFTVSMACGLTKLFEINSDSSYDEIQAFLVIISMLGSFTLLVTAPLTLHRAQEAKKGLENEPR